MQRAHSSLKFKIADVDELPPGKGKTTTVAGREITVYNREGRYVATSSARTRMPSGVLETTCDMPGHHFEVGVGPATTPDRLQSDDVRYQVQVDDGSIYVMVET